MKNMGVYDLEYDNITYHSCECMSSLERLARLAVSLLTFICARVCMSELVYEPGATPRVDQGAGSGGALHHTAPHDTIQLHRTLILID